MRARSPEKASAGHSSPVLRRRFARRNCRRVGLFGRDRQIAVVSCAGKTPVDEGTQHKICEYEMSMKPCDENRQPIAWLVMGALDDESACELRSHLQTCEGCRAYFEEISHV